MAPKSFLVRMNVPLFEAFERAATRKLSNPGTLMREVLSEWAYENDSVYAEQLDSEISKISSTEPEPTETEKIS